MCSFLESNIEMFSHLFTCRVGRRLFLDGDDGGVLVLAPLQRGARANTGSMQTWNNITIYFLQVFCFLFHVPSTNEQQAGFMTNKSGQNKKVINPPGFYLRGCLPPGGRGESARGGLWSKWSLWTFFMFKSKQNHTENAVSQRSLGQTIV